MSTVVMTSEFWDPVLTGLLSALEKSRQRVCNSEEEFDFLRGMFQSKELHALFKVHEKIAENYAKSECCRPVLASSMQVVFEVLENILDDNLIKVEDFKELFYILQLPHIQGLLYAHDAIAQKDYYPQLPEIPQDVDEDEETIKIVQLVKSNEPMGATIKADEISGKILIARVFHGGAADRSGLIHVGDEVVEVNGVIVEGQTPGDVLKILQSSEGTITFKLIPADANYGSRESRVRARAYFDYDPSKDPYIPCKEAGLPFSKGDILHIVCKEDICWWQARKDGDKNLRAGLIPSKLLQEQRAALERSKKLKEGTAEDMAKREKDIVSCISNPSACIAEKIISLDQEPVECSVDGTPVRCVPNTKTKKIVYDAFEAEDFDREEIATYEEVVKLYPCPGLPRPLVLIGPPGVGRNELKRRLIAMNSGKFHTPIPYTSRSPKPGEVHGKEYYFATREEMEKDIAAAKFIEFGEYKGNLYGTSAETVTELMSSGYTCILTPHYQALKMLRTPEVKPYVIYIKPPEFQVFKETRHSSFARSTFDETNSRGFTDDEFKEIIKNGKRIEFLYGHWFDEIIVNAKLSASFEQLLHSVYKIDHEPLWVPASWV